MKAFKITEKGGCGFFEIEKPTPQDGEVLVQVKKVGYCGSDLSTYRGINPLVSYPRIPGHELSGIVTALGANVPDHIKVGTQAAITPQTACGTCSSCKNNRPNACRYNETLGVQRDGALTEYIAVPWQKLVIDDSLSATKLALLEPLAVGFHASKRGQVKKGDKVVVLGCGVIGIGAIAGSAFREGEVIAVDLVDEKLEKAKVAGATHVINSSKENVQERLQELTDGHGADVIIEAAGNPITYKLAFDEISFTGRIVYIGYTPNPVSYETKFFVLKELDVRGSRGSEKEDFEHVLQAVKSGKIDPEEIVSHTFPFEKSDEAIKLWDADPSTVTKIVIEL
ncbi:zinc-binding alcohol dehydrogenase family protein [Saccharicrinis aurantiacus]|uniref:zinc-binding alcohol dehydrogenase family protein n=1 Tax=Saccharicrinis aurantiacus TaxID=1849719 RepID=UPI00083903A3|nr:zinc-binding alcohol dehydrogenase family protein [Saccharicrinis aurantiacus]